MSAASVPQSQPSRNALPMPDWVSLFAGVGMMALLGLVIDPGSHNIEPQTFGVIAGLGYLLGFVLAELRLPDLFAHLVAFSVGFVVASIAVEPRQTWSEVKTVSPGDFARRNWEYASSLGNAIRSGEPLPDDVAVMGIALTLWLVGYASAWMLFRRQWFIWSVALPATVLLTSLALDRDQDAWPALGFTGLAVAQGVVSTTRARQGVWQRRGIQGPRDNHRWAAIGGTTLAAIVIFAASSAALTIPQNTQDWVISQSERLAGTVEDQIDRLTNGDSPSAVEGNYGEFAEEFRVGEGVASGDSPVARLRAVQESYLTARNFDHYDGAGWTSTLGDLTDIDGLAPFGDSPQIAFAADQSMNLPRSVVENGVQVTGDITLYASDPTLLFTLNTHQSVSVPSAVRVGWQRVDGRFVVEAVAIDDVPLDLRRLIGLLRLTAFDEEALARGEISAIDPRLQGTIEEERESLLQYPVQTTLEHVPGEGIVLIASGRLPIYTDVEAVFNVRQLSGPYSATGIAPRVDPDILMSDSTSYPDHISQTYLQRSDTVTPRTASLAAQIVAEASATDPYSMAKAIETYLRANYQYLLESGLAPDGQDIVDYFLFENQIGRCDHFATSMAIMLRSLGVPTRLVTGLAPTVFDDATGGFLYRNRDAHAWVEVYFPDFGWIPFEPTPNQETIDLDQDSTSQQSPVQPTPEPEFPTPEAEQTPEPTPEATPAPVVTSAVDDGGETGLGRLSSFPGALLPIALGIAALGGLLALLWKLPLRDLAPGASYFFRLQRLGSFLGLKSNAAMTPGEYAERYASVGPRYTEAATAIADAYTDERYGPPELADSISERGLAGWRELRSAVWRWRPWRRERRDR